MKSSQYTSRRTCVFDIADFIQRGVDTGADYAVRSPMMVRAGMEPDRVIDLVKAQAKTLAEATPLTRLDPMYLLRLALSRFPRC
jgi:hypothetical protein